MGKKECYIYSILNKENIKNEDKTKYQKYISRLLYKLNNGVIDFESNEFKEYKNNQSDYYPENITDVSVSSVLSLYIFILLLENKGINIVKGVPYLPIRYNSRDFSANNMEDANIREQFKSRNDNIQYNITNKFIRTFNRLMFHNNNFKVETYPYEVDEFITCSISNESKIIKNELLNDIEDSVNKSL